MRSVRGNSKIRRILLPLAILALPLGGLAFGAGEEPPTETRGRVSAWDELLAREPGVADDPTIGPLERKMLDAVTPEQARAFAAGEDPSSIVLESGDSLSRFLAAAILGGPGLVYEPVDPCALFATQFQTAPVTGRLAANETREYFARAGTIVGGGGLTDQGGVPGCEASVDAVAVVLHLRVVPSALRGAAGYLKAWRADLPEPASLVVDYEPVIDAPYIQRRWNAMAIVELCPAGTCTTGELKVKAAALAAQVRADLVGVFRPVAATDLPSGMGTGFDADTLDGLDSLDFAPDPHVHDGADIVLGSVGEPFLDPDLARDDEVFPELLANDGSGSGVDLDLLDGLELAAFRPRPANVLSVHPTDGDYATIQAALDDIGVGLPAATAVNRYVVRVADGDFAEQVTMKPFVDIVGKGKEATKIVFGVDGGVVLGADDAELRGLSVINLGGFAQSVAILNSGTAPMITHVVAQAQGGTTETTGVLNDGVAAIPMLNHVVAFGGSVPGFGVRNVNGAGPEIRGSKLSGATASVQNEDTATARIANTELTDGAVAMAPALQSSFMCVRAYVGGTLQKLNAECFPNTPPTATDDSYKTLGNTLLEVDLVTASGAPAVTGEDPGPPALYADVLDNDTDAETPAGLTASLNGASVTAGAVVTMNPDGSFSYLPPVDMTGADTFEYTVTDAGGLTDVGMVTVDISTTMIWYVDKDNAGTADGRSSQPYTTLAPIDAGGADDGKDDAGDTIFVFTGTGNTTGGILLETNQVLQGNGAALDPAGFNYAGGGALVAAAVRPTISDGAGDVVDLASGSTVRGLNVSSSAGRAIDGTSIAGATIDGVNLGTVGTGTGVHFSGATGTIAVSNLDVLANSGSGIDIQGGSATFTFDSSTSVTSPNATAFNVNGGTAQVTYSGSITQANAFPAVSITGHANGAGSGITFGTGTVAATAGTGLQFSNADGTYNFNGTTTLNGGDAGIDILAGSNGTFTFAAGTTITNPTGIGFNVGTSTGGNINYNGTIGQTNAQPAVRIDSKTGGSATFSGAITASTANVGAINLTNNAGGSFTFSGLLNLTTTSGTAFNAGGGTIQVTNAGNTVNTAGDGAGLVGIGVNIDAAIGALGINFNTVNVGSSGGARSGIVLANTGSAGAFNVTGGTIQNTTVRSFEAENVDGTVAIGASLQNDDGRSVNIFSGSAGSLTFSGAIDEDGEGINIQSNAAGATFTFQGGIDADPVASNVGLRAFSGGTLNICADDNCSAAGGTAVVNTIDASGAAALVVDQVTIGAEGLTFERIAANGGVNGIVLDTTGSTAGLTVTGIDGPCGNTMAAFDCDGGTIQSTTGDGIVLDDTDAVSLSFMRILTIGNMAGASDTLTGHDGIDATDVNGLTLLDSVVESISDSGLKALRLSGLTIQRSLFRNANRYHVAGTADGTGSAEATLYLRDLSGTNLIKDSKLENGAEHVDVENDSTNLTLLTLQGNTFGDTWKDLAPGGALTGPLKGKIGVDIIAKGSSNMTVHIGDPAEATTALGNTFINHRIASLRVAHFDFSATGQLDAIISRNVFDVTETVPAIFDYAATGDQPQGGVALVTRGTSAARLNAIFSHNSFDFTQNADGRVGSLSVFFDGPAAGLAGEGQVKANNNSFNFPYGAAIDVAEDGTTRGVAFFDSNVITGGPVPPGLPFAGFPSPALPIEIFDQGSNGTLHTVWQNMTVPVHDTGFAPGSGLNFTRNNAGSTCTALSNVNAALGFDFNVFAGTKTLEQGASAVTSPLATVIANNGNTGAVTNGTGTVTVTGPMGAQVCDRPSGGIF